MDHRPMDFAALQASFKRYCEIATIDQRYKRTGNSIWDFIDFSNLETVQRCIRDVIANIYHAEPEKVALLQLVYFKNGRRLTPVEITTENDVFKALSEYPAYTSNSNVPVKLGACFIIDGKSVELKSQQSSSVDDQSIQNSPSPVAAVKSEVEEGLGRSTDSPAPGHPCAVSPVPTTHRSSVATSTTPWSSTNSKSEEEVMPSHRSETSSPAVLGQPMVAQPSQPLLFQHGGHMTGNQRSMQQPVIPTPVQAAQPVPVATQPKVIVKQDQFHVHMLESMNEFRKREMLCDLTLVTQDQIHFKVHRIVLISASPYFRSLQEHNVLKEKHVLADVSADTLSTLLDYMYGQGLTVSGETLSQVLAASYMLGVHGAIRLCEEFRAKFQPPVQEVSVSNAAHPVQLVNMNPSPSVQPSTQQAQPTTSTALVNVMRNNRRLRKSTPYPSYAAAIRRLREENNYDEQRYNALKAQQSSSREGPGSPYPKDLSLGSSNELDRSHDDDQMSHDTDDTEASEPLSLKVPSRENSDDSGINHWEREGGLSSIGRHRKAWRLHTHRAREESTVEQPGQQGQLQVKDEPPDNEHD